MDGQNDKTPDAFDADLFSGTDDPAALCAVLLGVYGHCLRNRLDWDSSNFLEWSGYFNRHCRRLEAPWYQSLFTIWQMIAMRVKINNKFFGVTEKIWLERKIKSALRLFKNNLKNKLLG